MEAPATEQPKTPGVPGAGRKSEYKPEYCQQLIEHMAKGYSFASFGAIVNVHRTTLYNWMEANPDFKDAFDEGTSKSLYWWETVGMQGTVGKLKGFNASVYALTMANKHKWRQAHDITSDGEKIETPILYIPEEKE